MPFRKPSAEADKDRTGWSLIDDVRGVSVGAAVHIFSVAYRIVDRAAKWVAVGVAKSGVARGALPTLKAHFGFGRASHEWEENRPVPLVTTRIPRLARHAPR